MKSYIFLNYFIIFFKNRFKNIKGCQLPHLHRQAVPQHTFAIREASFFKNSVRGFGTASFYSFSLRS